MTTKILRSADEKSNWCSRVVLPFGVTQTCPDRLQGGKLDAAVTSALVAFTSSTLGQALGFISANQFEPDVAAELFILVQPL
jgi:hypothetical protein